MHADGLTLVTGGGGFAGRHLVEALTSAGHDVDAPPHGNLDLLDPDAVRAYIRRTRPARVFHLAALASVARSWERPGEAVCRNQQMTVSVLEAVRQEAPDAAVLLASSGEVYGAPEELPVTEEALLLPRNPYAVSKAACEMVADFYGRVHGLRVVRTRAFNHAGPGQSPTYVVGNLTHQVAEAELAARASVTLRTGNVDVARDFCDVRDVARAYVLAVDAAPGVYNVATGRATPVKQLLAEIARATEIEVRHEIDPARVREGEASRVEGSPARLESATGWRPRIPLSQTVRDALVDWRDRLRNG